MKYSGPFAMNSKAIASTGATFRHDRRFILAYDGQIFLAGTIDALVTIVTSLAAGFGYHALVQGHPFDISELLGTGVATAALFIPLAGARGAYALHGLLSPSKQIRAILFAWCYTMLTLLGFAFVTKVSETFSRGAMILLALLGPVALVLGRYLLSGLLHSAFRTGRLARRKLVLVTDAAADVSDYSRLDCYIDRVFALAAPSGGRELAATAQDIVSHVRRSAPDAIDIALPWQRWDEIKTLAEAFRAVPLPVRLIPDSTAAEILSYPGRKRPTEFAVELQREPLTPWELRSKRALDVVLAAVALFVLSPLFMLIVFAVRLDTPGPVLFRQWRRGFNGQTFTIYKFRSMSVLENGPLVRQATSADPRVTRVGRWLRRSSLDELPQLLNVLKGDMSLVGPRPHAVAHDDQYTQLIANYAFRHHVKPGITGWAQVNGFRGETPTIDRMQRRIDHDLWYIANWSFWSDLWILVRTVLHLCRAPNAF